MHEEYPRLDELVGGYSNLDFDIIFETTDIEDVVKIVVTRKPLEALHQLMHEIADFELKYADCLEEAFYKTFDPDIYFDDVPCFLDMVKERVKKQLDGCSSL